MLATVVNRFQQLPQTKRRIPPRLFALAILIGTRRSDDFHICDLCHDLFILFLQHPKDALLWKPNDTISSNKMDIDRLLMGMASQLAEREDHMVVEDLRGESLYYCARACYIWYYWP